MENNNCISGKCRDYKGEINDFVFANVDILRKEYAVLDSAGNGSNTEYSYLMTEFKHKIILKNGNVILDNKHIAEIKSSEEFFEILREFKFAESEEVKGIFSNGWFGIIAYEFNKYIEDIKTLGTDDLNLPDACFVIPGLVIILNRVENKIYEFNYTNMNFQWNFDKYDSLLITDERDIQLEDIDSFTSNTGEAKFLEMVEAAKEYIAAGDIFQANLSQRFSCEFDEKDSLLLYRILRKINPSPFASFVRFDEFIIVSQSPERLVRLVDGIADTRPIAGTRRNKAETSDEMARELCVNDKEKAEHIMLVDLERNDLGRVCKYGSVRVDELMTIEKYSHVMHIASNIQGNLMAEHDAFDLINAMFPGGTITGAPKIRSMEIIGELEPTQRGYYTGSMGFVDKNGNMDFNIIIRSFIIKDGRAYFQVGAGVVYDSDPKAEYRETINKARAMMLALKIYNNIREGNC